MNQELIEKLQFLADKYEVASFCDADPSQFLRWYPLNRTADVECASFIAAMLAFGNRKQFIPKIQEILHLADSSGGIAQWCKSGASTFPAGEKKFYRFYSYNDMHNLFDDIAALLNKSDTLGEYFAGLYKTCENSVIPVPFVPLHQLISQSFPNSSIVPKGKASANKRIHMFLRWMVRQNSPVDLGIWNWANPADLLIPLDVHVMEESVKLGILSPEVKPTGKTAVILTEKLKEAFPEDPSRADFALFGLGVDKTE